MYLTKKQIDQFVQLIGQPEASVLLNKFFNAYKSKLSSADVANLYDAEYLQKIENHPVAEKLAGQFSINIYNYPSYEFISKAPKGSSILDIGCGVGDFLLALATKGFSGMGVDFNKASIEAAQTKSKNNNVPIKFICMDATDIDESNSFDFIVMNDVTEHVSDSELVTIFNKTKKLLKPSGKFLMHTPNGLALCHDIDSSMLQKIYKNYLKYFKGYQGFERGVAQIFYDQVHINIKSFKQLNKILRFCGFKATVNYEIDPVFYKIKFLNSVFKSVISSNMLVIASHR